MNTAEALEKFTANIIAHVDKRFDRLDSNVRKNTERIAVVETTMGSKLGLADVTTNIKAAVTEAVADQVEKCNARRITLNWGATVKVVGSLVALAGFIAALIMQGCA